MAILQATDFTENPTYNIALTMQAECELDTLIATVEEDYLQELLGCKLYDLFIADLTPDTPQEPQDPIYISIFEKFCEDDTICGILRSRGMIDMLMSFVYFEWHRYNLNKSTSSGVVRADSENSNQVSGDGFGIYDKFNRGLESYKAIQWYICENSEDYPDFNGTKKNYISFI